MCFKCINSLYFTSDFNSKLQIPLNEDEQNVQILNPFKYHLYQIYQYITRLL